MRNLLKLLPAFRRTATLPAIPEKETPPVSSIFDQQSAALFHDTLMYLIPSERLQMTAFDDYYPAVFYTIGRLPNSGEFIQALRTIREDLLLQYEKSGAAGFENVVRDNIRVLSLLKQLMEMPAEKYPADAVSGIHSKPDQPLFHDLKTNTRGGRHLHNEGVDLLLEKIGMVEDKIGFQIHAKQHDALPQTLILPAPTA